MNIFEVFNRQGLQLAAFDMGCRLSPLSANELHHLEHFQQSYPFPYNQHAWLGFIAWPEVAAQASSSLTPNLWFVRLPLDEQQQWVPSARDAVAGYWQRAFANPSQEHGELPFGIKPDIQRMAYFHAHSLLFLKQAPTKFYHQAQHYLADASNFDQWPMLGLQGLAEVVARHAQDNNQELIAQAITQLPAEPRNLLLGFLENITPAPVLSAALQELIQQGINEEADAQTLSLYVRAISQSEAEEIRTALLQTILIQPQAQQMDVLAAVASRCWRDLQGNTLRLFLEVLAHNPQGQAGFKSILVELFAQPNTRQHCHQLLQETPITPELASAFKQLFNLQ